MQINNVASFVVQKMTQEASYGTDTHTKQVPGKVLLCSVSIVGEIFCRSSDSSAGYARRSIKGWLSVTFSHIATQLSTQFSNGNHRQAGW